VPAALLVIDLQQALCFGEDGAFQAERVISRINEVASRVRAAGRPVIFVQHGAEGSLTPGSAGWQLATGVGVSAEDALLRKGSPDAFHCTGGCRRSWSP